MLVMKNPGDDKAQMNVVNALKCIIRIIITMDKLDPLPIQ